MKKPRTLAEKKRLVEAFADLFDEQEMPGTPEEIDQFLRLCGYDPEEVGKRMAAVAERAFARMRDNLED